MTEDRIVGHIVDVRFPVEDWQASGMLNADLTPTDQMTEGMPLFGLACLHKRAKGVERILAEHKANGGMWATSVEILFPWSSAAFLVNGEMIAAIDAPDDLLSAVQESWANSDLPNLRYKGHPVHLIGGGEDGEVLIAGSALTTFPADSGADILQMAASLDSIEEDPTPPREELPDTAFLYVEDTGTVNAQGRTEPDTARHYPIWKANSSIDIAVLEVALAECNQAKAATEALSDWELQGKLTRLLLPLAEEHTPDNGFAKEHGKAIKKGGDNMTLIEMLQKVKASLEELAQTDGFQAHKEANTKVTAAKNDLYAVMDQADGMVSAMAADLAKTLAEESVAENFVTKEAHDKALADVKAESDKAVETAKATWDSEQADKDAKTTLVAERMDKLRELKVETVPDNLKDAIENMSSDEAGVKAFDEMIGRLEARRKLCADAEVVLSESVQMHIAKTLAEADEDFTATLELWKSLKTGTAKASLDSKPKFIPTQKSGDSDNEMAGAC